MAEHEQVSPAISPADEPAPPEVPAVDRGSLAGRIKEEFHKHGSSSSSSESDSEEEKHQKGESSVKDKIFRLFGRERPVHAVLGGGKPADILMWKNKKVSTGILGVATLMWLLFDVLDYFLVTLVCHCLIFSLAILFLWSNATTVINKSPPHIPNVQIPEDVAKDIAIVLRFEINRAFSVLRDIALGRDPKKFLAVIAGLWLLSIIGNSCNFLTLLYIAFVLLFTVPALYENYENKIDPIAEKAALEFKKQYAVFGAKVLSKIPKGLKNKKH